MKISDDWSGLKKMKAFFFFKSLVRDPIFRVPLLGRGRGRGRQPPLMYP